MILDSLANAGLYESVHPRFKKAFEYLRSTDLKALPVGKIELEGTSLVVLVVDHEGKTPEQSRMETHQKFIDIQMPIGANETMGWVATDKLIAPTDAYNPDKDVAFFADKASNFVLVQPYQFAVFFPTDAHQPGIGAGTYRKIIVKVLV